MIEREPRKKKERMIVRISKADFVYLFNLAYSYDARDYQGGYLFRKVLPNKIRIVNFPFSMIDSFREVQWFDHNKLEGIR
jgi:hypothetical protein